MAVIRVFDVDVVEGVLKSIVHYGVVVANVHPIVVVIVAVHIVVIVVVVVICIIHVDERGGIKSVRCG